jgi:Protein of unknown function (DUF1203)
MSFQLVGLPFEPFAGYFGLSDRELHRLGMQRVEATEEPGYPCRVSLRDAEVGEELLLVSYMHQPEHSPYRASGPIFVRKGATQRVLEPDLVPDYVTSRLMSIRAYDSAHLMIDAAVCDGSEAAFALNEMFGRNEVSYIHLHNAKRGCFSCRAIRAALGS